MSHFKQLETSKRKKTRKPEHMDLSILDENALDIFDDLLSNVIKKSISLILSFCF